MSRLSFCLKFLLIGLCINYSLNASNFYEHGTSLEGSTQFRAVAILKSVRSYAIILIGAANCFSEYKIGAMSKHLDILASLINNSNESISRIKPSLSQEEEELLKGMNCVPELEILFDDVYKIVRECLTEGLRPNRVKLFEELLFQMQMSILPCIASVDTHITFPGHSLEDISNSIQLIISSSAYSVTRMLKLAYSEKPTGDDSEKKESKKEKAGANKKLSNKEYEKASKDADLNAHLLLGCCKDGTCGSLENKSRSKTRNKKGGGRKKRMNDVGLDQEEISEACIKEETHKESCAVSDPLLGQLVQIVELVINKLKEIAFLEEKLQVLAFNYQAIMREIEQNSEIAKNEKLKDRVCKLPKDVIFKARNEQEIEKLKSEYTRNLKKMSESSICTCTGEDCKIIVNSGLKVCYHNSKKIEPYKENEICFID
ncbi:uncharacterized protein cubi_00008 [Cryptosporidium ubiquitum]|uniref:Uncharacterized protein n=1 Tax=Cryptosporidium ubiquitum TaxID=857276 RepID=A0A1J4MKA6_9CRYT|nr:uncharacterized protein cubi_00008 [Cryptosporidium ubiquitum]OII74455.1 hypothetical protein cubi_00008 [Cryptosporidium ubiquitum]